MDKVIFDFQEAKTYSNQVKQILKRIWKDLLVLHETEGWKVEPYLAELLP